MRQAVIVIHGIGEQRPMSTLRGFVDAVIAPERTRAVLAFALFTALHHAGPTVDPDAPFMPDTRVVNELRDAAARWLPGSASRAF